MSALSTLRIVKFIRSAMGFGRSFSREWADWATENPQSAAVQCELWRSVMDHRIRMLRSRRWAFRKSRRITRLLSLREELDDIATYFRNLARLECDH